MSNKSLFSLAFIIGAATGSVVTWYLLKDKYEALAQEEIDSVSFYICFMIQILRLRLPLIVIVMTMESIFGTDSEMSRDTGIV